VVTKYPCVFDIVDTVTVFNSICADVPETWIRVNWMLHRLHVAAPHAAVTIFLDCCREARGAVPYDPPVMAGERSGQVSNSAVLH
jgi:hypothetical protein